MTHIERNISKGQVVALAFGQDAVAASQTNVQIPVVMAEASQANDGYAAPWDGEIVAVAFQLSAAGSAGTLTIGATVGGTEDADTTLTITTAADGYQRVQRGKARFVAGNVIGCEITSDGSWNGTTSDLAAQVYVLYYLDGI